MIGVTITKRKNGEDLLAQNMIFRIWTRRCRFL